MPENEIIAEVRRHREELARESGYNIRELLRRLREDEQHFVAQGHPLVSFFHEHGELESCIVREESPKG